MAWYDADPIVEDKPSAKVEGNWWKNDPVVEEPKRIAPPPYEYAMPGGMFEEFGGAADPKMVEGATSTKPLIPIPRINVDPSTTRGVPGSAMPGSMFEEFGGPMDPRLPKATLQGLAAGVNQAAGLAEFIESPTGLTIAPVAGAEATLGRLAAAGFTVDMVKGLPEQIKAYQEAKTPQEKNEAALGIMGTGLFILGGGKHALSKTPLRAGEVSKVDDSTRVSPQSQPSTTERLPETTTGHIENETRLPQPEITTPIVDPQWVSKEVSGLKEPQAESVEAQGQKKPFVPSTEWQEVPPGTVLPNGGEYRMDQETGKNYARWKPENLPPDNTRSASASVPSPSDAAIAEQPLTDTDLLNRSEASGKTSPETTPTSTKNAATGVANRVLAEEAKAGRIDPVESGEGMSWKEMVDLGRQQINAGADPQMIARRFQRTQRISAPDFAVLRAERERLAVETNKLEEQVRANPNDVAARNAYNQARKTEVDWIQKVVQPAKTATSDIFRGMQGEAPIDATTFAGLRRAALDLHGKDVNPTQAATLMHVAAKAEIAARDSMTALQRASQRVEREFGRNRKTPPRDLDTLRNDLAQRLKEATPC